MTTPLAAPPNSRAPRLRRAASLPAAILVLALCATSGAWAAPAAPASADAATTPAEWSRMPWGELGIMPLATAPYPDDSRTTGFTNRSGQHFPHEGHYDDPSVAFCVPDGYRRGPKVDLVVILHGHRSTCARFVAVSDVGAVLARSGRNAIVVVPQGPKEAADSGGGKFEKPGGFSAFLGEAVARLGAEGRVPPDARPGNVVLCGYSGGGRPVGLILRNGDAADLIRDVWLVDSAYEQHDGLVKPVARPGATTALRSIFTAHLTEENIDLMSRITVGGGTVALINDIVTTETLASAAAGKPMATAMLTGYADILAPALRRHPVLFIRTHLPHDIVGLSVRYLEPFMRESPALSAR